MTTQTTWGDRTLLTLFGSEARARILTYLFLHADSQVFLRDLAQQCGLSLTPVHRQMQKLERIGLVRSQLIGKASAYQLAPDFPARGALAELVARTTGTLALLREALAPLDVQVGFVFGSIAGGQDRAGSDVDLFVIGNVGGLALSEALATVEARSGKEVNSMHFTPDEFRERMRQPSSFLTSVMRKAKAFVKGDEDALHQLAGG
jgi:predicted nucleotidyltransferase